MEKSVKCPFISTYKLVFNPEYTKIYDKYESMNMPIPESEEAEKYLRVPFTMNGMGVFAFSRDLENKNWTFLEYPELEHLLEIPYEELKEKVLDLYR